MQATGKPGGFRPARRIDTHRLAHDGRRMRGAFAPAGLWMLIATLGCAAAPREHRPAVESADLAAALEHEEPIWLYTLADAQSTPDARRAPGTAFGDLRNTPDAGGPTRTHPLLIPPEPAPSPPREEAKAEQLTPLDEPKAARTTPEQRRRIPRVDSEQGLTAVR